jgi:CRISPR-associated endonuclease/helicase Cas3
MKTGDSYFLKDLIAHIKKKDNKTFDVPHYLDEHLLTIAKYSKEKSSYFGLEKLSFIIGLLHDLGKASIEFQDRIRLKSGYEAEEAHLEGKSAQSVDHSTAGAQYVVNKYGELAKLLAYIIAGHHSGLPNGIDESDSCLKNRLKKEVKDYSRLIPWIETQLPNQISQHDFIPKEFKEENKDSFQFHFLIRMLFSSLTDSDFLDTESYMDLEKKKDREKEIPSIVEIGAYFSRFLKTLPSNNQNTLNTKRNIILKDCLKAALNKRGIFSLTVPTGGGKTLSSMAFALNHAVEHNLRRIIYIIPYITIIEQNAKVFKDIFNGLNENIVLEHHSNIHLKSETPTSRLASENWDAPIIITTNVQFFESFYSNRTSACRKLHNIVDSVLIFDEAQMLPRDYLSPCLSVISELTNHYGCSAVICTATQPAILKSELLINGLQNVTEIIPDPVKLYKDFKRVEVKKIAGQLRTEEIARMISENDQVLCVVNTRKSARKIFEELEKVSNDPGSCYHLSTMMCAAHRTNTLNLIRKKLKDNEPCLVVSTQLIEAGVDIDFPAVFRAIAGIDSIAQAAGRCNRENKLEKGWVFIFEEETLPPAGHLRQAAESGQFCVNMFDDPLSPESIQKYFKEYYNKDNSIIPFDKKGITEMCKERLDAIPFKEISKNFQLIAEVQYPVIVPYGEEGVKLIEQLRKCYNGMVNRELRKQLKHFTVQLRERVLISLRASIEDVFKDEQFFVLTNKSIYSDKIGLNPDDPVFRESESNIF